MPDDNGRLNLGELREAVWRNLAALYPGTVDPFTGEAGNPRIDPLYTKQDLDRWINESLTGQFLDITENSDTMFSDSAALDVVANVAEVQLPDDMAFFRSAWWKDPNTSLMQQPPSERAFMWKVDDPTTSVRDLGSYGSVPRYSLTMDFIVLDPTINVDNPGGILVKYVKWAQYLAQDAQYIESPLARMIQECVALEAAMIAASRKAFLDVTPLKISYDTWRDRLMAAARRFNLAPAVQLTTVHPIRYRPGARSSFGYSGGYGYGGRRWS